MRTKHVIITNEEELLNILNERADEIDIIKDESLMNKIVSRLKTLIKKNKCLALSAPQIGYNYRIFCINFNGDIRTFINPMIVKSTGLHLSRESCVSISNNEEYLLLRNDEIIAMYQTPTIFKYDNKPEQNKFINEAASLFQQMTNLLDGILISDIGEKLPDNFDELSDEEQTAFVDNYVNTIKEFTKSITDMVNEDPELKQQLDAIDFMTKVSTGEIKLEKNE